MHAFTLKPRGAGFELVGRHEFLWGSLVTDVDFGPDGYLYVSDWVWGWAKPNKGRIYRIRAPQTHLSPITGPVVREVQRLLAEGMAGRGEEELAELMGHADRRVRLEAQLELASRGSRAMPTLRSLVAQTDSRLARLHAVWGLGQIYRRSFLAPLELYELTVDLDPEVRAQAARCLADVRTFDSTEALLPLLEDPLPRVRFFAALGLGRGGRSESIEPLLELLRRNADTDPYLRHAGVMGLTWIGDVPALLARADDSSPAARMGVLLALRRLEHPEVARFLGDPDPLIALEAARAVYDVPIPSGTAALAARIDGPPTDSAPLLRRVLAAAHRLGEAPHAEAVARFAARADAPEAARIEALELLAAWQHPPPRDRVTNAWRPVVDPAAGGSRPADFLPATVDSLYREFVLTGRFRGEPAAVQLALVDLFGALRHAEAGGLLLQIAGEAERPPGLRTRCLEVLAELGDPELSQDLSLIHI